jgi:hypothetical protein
MITVLPSDKNLRYMGRIDFAAPDAPEFYWPGSLVQFRFTGSALSFQIRNHSYDAGNGNGLSLGLILDGKQQQLRLSAENDTVQTVTVPVTGDGAHTAVLFKRQDGPHYYALCGITLADGAAVSPLELPSLKIEAYGDSVTAGSWVEICDRVGQTDYPDYTAKHDNAWHSYAMQTGRLLNAQVHLTAQGGIALLDGTGYYENGDVGMETAYTKMSYQPASGKLTDWDFSRYVPDVVTFAIGQNDHHVGTEDNLIPDAEKRERWLDTYCRIIRDLMEKYPKAQFVLLLTVLMHDEYWEQMLDEACARIGSSRVTRLRFTRSGKATPGHPRIPEQCEMACELTEYLRGLLHLNG